MLSGKVDGKLPKHTRKWDDPHEFDRTALGFLRSRYGQALGKVRTGLEEPRACEVRLCGELSRDPKQWTLIARHLLLAFAACEALGHDPMDHLDIWQAYSAIRILPILQINEHMHSDRSPSIGPDRLLMACLHAIAALAGSEEYRISVPRFAAFWSVVAGVYHRMVVVVCEEVSLRYDARLLSTPEAALDKYETQMSPLLRSSMLEMPLLGLAKAIGRKVEPSAWISDFERARQLLDDVADVREDLGRGRLTYPVLVALAKPEGGGLQAEILRVWERIAQTSNPRVADAEWLTLKGEIANLGGYADSGSLAMGWLDEVEKHCPTALNGNLEPLHTHVELKRAFWERLCRCDFDDRPPQVML